MCLRAFCAPKRTAVDLADLDERIKKISDDLASIKVEKALAIGVHTDILFPLQQQEQVADGLRAGGAEAGFLALESPQGHDAFLVDIARFGPAIGGFLARL